MVEFGSIDEAFGAFCRGLLPHLYGCDQGSRPRGPSTPDSFCNFLGQLEGDIVALKELGVERGPILDILNHGYDLLVAQNDISEYPFSARSATFGLGVEFAKGKVRSGRARPERAYHVYVAALDKLEEMISAQASSGD